MADAPHETTLSGGDIEALQLLRSAASVALDSGRITEQFRDRIRGAVVRVTQIIQEASRVR